MHRRRCLGKSTLFCSYVQFLIVHTKANWVTFVFYGNHRRRPHVRKTFDRVVAQHLLYLMNWAATLARLAAYTFAYKGS